jgi:hypothetical protein
MAERIEWFDITVSAGTAKAAAVEQAVSFQPAEVERIELTIPDGHAGLTGIAFLIGHQQLIPFKTGLYVVGNGVERSWDMRGYPNNGAWSVLTYNTDIYDHMFHIAFLVNELGAASTAPVKMIPAASLGSTAITPATVATVAGSPPAARIG